MVRILVPALNEALTTLKATEFEKQMLVGFLQNQVSSVYGRVNGLRSSAADLSRQADQVEVEASYLQVMLDKFTDVVVEEPPIEEPLPEEPQA